MELTTCKELISNFMITMICPIAECSQETFLRDFSRYSDPFAAELLENHEEMFPLYYMHININSDFMVQ